MKYYHYDIYGRYTHCSDIVSDRCTEVAPNELSSAYNWNDVEWIYFPNIMIHPILPN